MSTQSCALCGRPDAFGLGVCADCGGTAAADDVLIFVRRAQLRQDAKATRQRLLPVLGGRAETADGRSAAHGSRAIIRVPAVAADRVVNAFEQRGVPARAIPARRAWTAMPLHFFVMLASIAFAGGMAGLTSPAFAWMSPLFATILLVLAQRSMARPLVAFNVADRLPDDVETGLAEAFARTSGPVRDRLADLARMVRPLVATLERERDPAGLVPSLADLVRAACATAHEVERLQTTIAAVNDTLLAGGQGARGELLAAAGRCREAADAGTRRLIDAVAAVADIGGRTALDTSTGSRLDKLTRALTDEARRHENALRELDRLLSN